MADIVSNSIVNLAKPDWISLDLQVPVPLVGQLGWGAAGMLIWASAALIPVLLHLWRKNNRQQVPWAAMRLLRQVVRHQSQKIRWQQWLLLLIRTGVLLTLALAVSLPHFRSSTTPKVESKSDNRNWILAVDISYSMGYTTDGQSRLQRAKSQLRKLVQSCPEGDRWILVALTQPPRVLARPGFDRQAMLEAIDQISTEATGCDLQATALLMQSLLDEGRQSQVNPQTYAIQILSDLGSDAWYSQTDPTLPQTLVDLAKNASLTIVPILESKPPVNTAVTSVQSAGLTGDATIGQTIQATVVSQGKDQKQVPVRLSVNDRVYSTTIVDLIDGQPLKVHFDVPESRPGQQTYTVDLPSDRLPIDDSRSIVVDIPAMQQILMVQERLQSANPWQLALESKDQTARTEPTTNRNIRVVSRRLFNTVSLKQIDMVLVDNLQLQKAELEKLTSYTLNGGAVAIALGDQSLSTNMSSNGHSEQLDLLEKLAGIRLGPISPADVWPLDPLEYSSPLTQVFADHPNAGLLTTPVFRFWTSTAVANDVSIDLATRPHASLPSLPIIVRRSLGRGSVCCWLSAPQSSPAWTQESWNAIAAWPSFVPLARQTVEVLLSSRSAEKNLIIGQPLIVPYPTSAAPSALLLQLPDRTSLTLMADSLSASAQWIFPRTECPGIYRAQLESRLDSQSQPTNLFAVNIDPIQSQLHSIDPQRLPTQWLESSFPEDTRSGNNTSLAGWKPLNQSNTPDAGQHDTSLGRWLLIATGILLACESLLAWRLGRQLT